MSVDWRRRGHINRVSTFCAYLTRSLSFVVFVTNNVYADVCQVRNVHHITVFNIITDWAIRVHACSAVAEAGHCKVRAVNAPEPVNRQ